MEENEIYENNIGLLYMSANKYQKYFNAIPGIMYDFEDLVQIGGVGLINAIRSFDNSQPCKFSTYATTCIINALLSDLTSKTHQKRNPINFKFLNLQHALTDDESDGALEVLIGQDDMNYSGIECRMLIKQVIEVAKEALPKTKFDVWYAHYIKGITPRELAQIYKIPRTTMCMRIKSYERQVIIAAKIKLKLKNEDLIS